MYRNEKENIATSEMVETLIEKYYSNINDAPIPKLTEPSQRGITLEDLKKCCLSKEELFAQMLSEFDTYENKLQELADLSCILDDSSLQFRSKETYEKYVNYLIENLPDLLLDVVCLLRWLNNDRKKKLSDTEAI